MRRYVKDDDEWLDEYLNLAAFNRDELIGRVVILYNESGEVNTFIIKDESAFHAISCAPNGSIMDIADHLDTDPAFGLA